ncbi:MAG: lactonase family protein [Lachnospiraceae bacterium]|nr:lactonase family protein [Lachnospiraceae bacterium]
MAENNQNIKDYVAYVSTYTSKDKRGITIYDVDNETGVFTEKGKVEISNSSYLTCAHNRKYLYSITDFGVKGFRILKDGYLEEINEASINGMRGCYLSVDYKDRFLFVSGYHDGKLTVLRLNEDGSVGEITEEIFFKGLGDVMEKSFQAHVTCAKMSRDNKYLFATDSGMDHTYVYELNHDKGTLKQVDIIRSEMNAGPRHLITSADGKNIYIVNETTNTIDVFTYEIKENYPVFEKIQTISTLNDYHASRSISCTLTLSADHNHIVATNAGDNSVAIFKRDEETGMLTRILCLPISGAYPKDALLYPDNKHLVSLNHEAGTMTFFKTDLEKGLIYMTSKEIRIEHPNCIIFVPIKENGEA